MSEFLTQRDKNIGIFGLGNTGRAAYLGLRSIANVLCYDQTQSALNSFVQSYGNKNIADISDPKWQKLDKILLSPGVPLSHEIVQMANLYNIPITSDIDLLYEEVEASGEPNFIAVTGTNGKSTTSALISHILRSCGFDYPVAGNIGAPAMGMPLSCTGYVLELSSFQLDLLRSFKAKIAILLNITKDHLDRHNNMQNYIAAKEKIFERMDKDSIAIISVDNVITKDIFLRFQKESTLNLIPISTNRILKSGVSIVGNVIYDNISSHRKIHFSDTKFLQGDHNKENIVASYAASRIIGVDSDSIISSIQTFEGLPHRMQYIGSIGAVKFYNDSKATNAEAASKSISSLNHIYWLAGGIAKEGDISELQPLFHKIRKAYLFGQDKELLAKRLNDQVPFQICQDLSEAFNFALKEAVEESISQGNILLAPACASYDQFKNFEERGEKFIELYNNVNYAQRR